MTQYAGDPNAFPIDFLMPDDSAPPQAAEFNPALEALGDRTANLNARAVVQRTDHDALALAIAAARGMNFAPTSDIKGSLCKLKNGIYFFMSRGAGDFFFRTTKLEGLASAVTEITGGATTNPNDQQDFDVAEDGTIVLVDNQADALKKYDGSAWTKQTGMYGRVLKHTTVVWEPVSQLWCIAGTDTDGTHMRVFTSPNRTTWTERTASAHSDGAWTMGTDGLGRIVLMRHGLAGGIHFIYSDDGGINWSTEQVITLGAGSLGAYTSATNWVYFPRPVWNGKVWLACVSNGSNLSEVYSSPDGETWTLISECSGFAIRWLAAIGDAWLALVGSFAVAMSLDGGVTWRLVPIEVSGPGVSTIGPSGPPGEANRFLICGLSGNKARIGHAIGGAGFLIAEGP